MKKTPLLFLLTALTMSANVYADYVQPNIQHEAYGKQKVAYHLNSGDTQEHLRFIGNVNNHINAIGNENIELQIVIHGAGLSLLQTDNEKLNKAIDGIREKGIKIAICNNTLRGKNVNWSSLRGVKENDIVPSGVAELAYLQQKGFTYIKP
jgi:uncharacterized protein